MDIAEIQSSIIAHRVRITDHADEEAANDRLFVEDVFFSVMNGEIIEDYPDDKPYPSCLILGHSPSGSPIHSVWAYNRENNWSVLITVYKPDSNLWINWRIRRKKS
jgi:hypothetical protein